MGRGKIERAAANDEKKRYDLEKIESAAVRAVEDYIDSFSKMKSYIFTNDKTPIWDGEIYVHNNDIKENRTNKNFFAKIPLQVKGTTNTTDKFYWIGREHLIGYKKERGTIFFLVQEDEKYKPIKILYNMLSSDALDTLLDQDTKNIKIDLKKMPENPNDFEKEIFEFARKRNGEKIENPATKEIESIVKKFDEIGEHINEIDDEHARYDLESLLNIIKKLRDNGTVGWRDKFVYYSQKAIELAINNLKNCDFTNLQFALGTYLHKQKQYHLVEDYYVKALQAYRERAKVFPYIYNINVANILNNLANLHSDLNRPDDAEAEYEEALKIKRALAKDYPETYMGDMATTINNLATLHNDLNRPDEAEKEYQEALEIYRRLAKDNPAAYMGYVADTLNNLAVLHKNLNRPAEAEKEYQEALEIRRRLAKDNPAAYMGCVASTLNGLAYLYASQKEFSKAIDAIDQTIVCMPVDAEYYDSKGEILLMQGYEQGALEMWRKVMELDPDFLSKYDGETELHRQLKEKGIIDK